MSAQDAAPTVERERPRGEDQPRFEQRMSDAEALMWHVEKDPWLNPSGATLHILDRPIDVALFRRRMKAAVAHIPRLRQRVVPGLGRLSTPAWATDPEFDFDYHFRTQHLGGEGTTAELYRLATRLYEEPFDRTRPLWLFVVIDGLAGGRGALFWKTHHSISDGQGMVRLSERFMERERHPEPAPDVDLDALIAAELANEADELPERGGDWSRGLLDTASRSIGHLVRRQAGISRRLASEAALWVADPLRARDTAGQLVASARGLLDQARGGREAAGGSPLWKGRSRRRHIEALQVPLADAQRAAKALGGSVNDFFVAGAVMGAVRYHGERATPVDAFNISFVVSTRTDKEAGGNFFTPARVQVPGAPAPAAEQFARVRDILAARRAEVTGKGAFSSIAGVANLLPTSVVTRVARAQAAGMDFATSNVRAAPFPMYVSRARIVQNVTLGPVAGTAYNLTLLSYNGSLDIGAFIDPVAVESPGDLRRCMEEAYVELIAAGDAASGAAAAGRAESANGEQPAAAGGRAARPHRAPLAARATENSRRGAKATEKSRRAAKATEKRTAKNTVARRETGVRAGAEPGNPARRGA